MSEKELGWALKNGEIDKVKEIIGSNVSVFIVLYEIAITHQKSVFTISRKKIASKDRKSNYIHTKKLRFLHLKLKHFLVPF